MGFLTPPTPLIIPHRLLAFLESLMLLKNRCSIHARSSKSSLKHSIRFCGIFPSLKQNFIAYRSSKESWRPDCIFGIYLLWQSGFCRVYSSCCCSCSFEPEIIKIGQSSHNVYSNNIVHFQGSTIILNACTKKVWKHIEFPTYIYISRQRLDNNRGIDAGLFLLEIITFIYVVNSIAWREDLFSGGDSLKFIYQFSFSLSFWSSSFPLTIFGIS